MLNPMATRLEGWAAIAFAERAGALVSVHAAGGEAAREGVLLEEARRIAADEPDRVYIDFDEEAAEGSRMA
jgi:hypothetical protein